MGRYGTWELSSKSNLEFESLGYVRYVNAELSLMTSSASGSRPTRRSERIARQIAVTNLTHISPTLATMSDSSLASVVLVDLGKKWVKVTDKEALAPFHTKFWGKSMEDEEAEWRKEPRQIEGPGDEDEDEGRHEGKGKGRAIDEGEDEVMDTDEDEPETDADELEGEATDEDQDVIPGCYPFNVGIEDITVWIRADYIRVFEGLQRSFEKAMKQRGRTPSAVITGQPGIGEFRYSASSAYSSIPRIKEKAFGSIMPLVAFLLKKEHSSGSIRRAITCLCRRAFTSCPLIGNMTTSVISCGHWSIRIRAKLVFQKFSFPKARASSPFMSHLRLQIGGRVCTRPRAQLGLS